MKKVLARLQAMGQKRGEMRSYPTEQYENEEVSRLKAEPWQIELLKLNPNYTSWGPHEDYMWKEKEGWDSRVISPSWKEFGPWELNDMNEVVNFYFSLNRDSRPCECCGGRSYHPDAQWVSESFYGHSTPFRRQNYRELQSLAVMAQFGTDETRVVVSGFPSEEIFAKYKPEFRTFCEEMRNGSGEWSGVITKDEEDALRAEGRSWDGPFGHDAINRMILIRVRCARFGIPVNCLTCEGHGAEFTEPSAHVNLTLWVLHPRKGCSRGIEVQRIQQSELESVYGYLKQAAERSASRFDKLP